MARKLALLMVFMGAVLGFAWYFGAFTQPTGEEQDPVLGNTAAQPANASASVPAMSSQEESSQSVTAAVREPNPLAEPSVVGMRFELSESVRANCQRWRDSICKDYLAFLERMAAEPRDAIWARDMEARIEKAVAGERGKFRIRALECRSTRCALEVASEVDSVVDLKFDSDPVFDNVMTAIPGYFARENDSQTGITTMVSAEAWQTSESYDAEQARTD